VTDADALRSLLQRYARAADSRDVDALAALFHPDATIRGTRGAQSITEWLDTMRGPRAFPMSMHVLADPLIEFVEGADGGTLDTYAVVYQLGDRDAGQNDLVLGMRYVDTVVRVERRWVIRHREATTLWTREQRSR
jgi:SnoaL-like domain